MLYDFQGKTKIAAITAKKKKKKKKRFKKKKKNPPLQRIMTANLTKI